MNTTPLPDDDRMVDLLIEQSIAGLNDHERRELETHPRAGFGADVFDAAVATLDVAFASEAGAEALPDRIRSSLADLARVWTAEELAHAPPEPLPFDPAAATPAGAARDGTAPSPGFWRSGGGWVAAAVFMLLAVSMWWNQGASVTAQCNTYEQLLSSGGDVIQLPLAGLPALNLARHDLDGGVSGDLIWSDERNQGFMRISGISPNEPTAFQYQLWIFDAERPTGALPRFETEGIPILTQRPVDGGVFDIAEDGEVIVPIDAKLPIGRAALFAVTKEPPGGVVVSERDIVFLAVRDG